MRITNNMLVNDFNRNLNTNLSKMDRLQMMLSSGKKINKPSDDPAGASKALRLRTNLTEGAQYSENVAEGMNYMNATDSAMSSITEVLQKVRELTVQGATATNEKDSWAAISSEIRQLNEQMQLLSNSQYGTKYLFAGTNVTEMPWNSSSGTWSGNDEDMIMEIAAGITSPVNLKMREFFMGRLNDLVLDSVRSGVRNIIPKNLQEGSYNVATETNLVGSNVDSSRSARGAAAAYYLRQAGGGNPAVLAAGQTAGFSNSEYQGEIKVSITAVDQVNHTATANISGRIARNGQPYNEVNFQGIELNMDAANGEAIFRIPATAVGNNNSMDDFVAGAVQDLVLWNNSPAALQGVIGSMAAGQQFGVQLSTNAAGTASRASELPAELNQIQDNGSFFWNDDLTPAAVSTGTNAQLQDSPYSGGLQIRVTGVNTPAAQQMTVDVTGRLALPGGEYKEIQVNGLVMQMNAIEGQAIMTIPVAALQTYIPEATQPLVLWNSSGKDLQGIKNPAQFTVGDSTVLELGSTESQAVETSQYLSSTSNYKTFFYEGIDQSANLGVGSSTNKNDSSYNGSLLIEAKRVDVANNKVVVDINGHVYLDDGTYKSVEMQNVELDMKAGAGQAIITIPATLLPGGKEDLVLWNNSLFGNSLGGLKLIPEDSSVPDEQKTCQITAGDRCVLALSARQFNAGAAEQCAQNLTAPDSNGMFFFLNGTTPASIASGDAPGSKESPFSGNLNIQVNAVNQATEQLTVTVSGTVISPDGTVHALGPIAGINMQMNAAPNAAIMTLTAAQINLNTVPAAAFTQDLVLWNNSVASLGAITDGANEFAVGDTVGIDIFQSIDSSARIETGRPTLNSLSNNGMFFFDNALIPKPASLVAGNQTMMRNSAYNGDLNFEVTAVNPALDTLTVNVTGTLSLPGGESKEVSFVGLTMDMAADHAAGDDVLTIPAAAIAAFIPGATEDFVLWSPSTLGGIDNANPEFAVGDKVSVHSSSGDVTDIGFQYKDQNGATVDGGEHSFRFQEGTMDQKTTDLKFYTLYERTGLEFDGSMGMVTQEFGDSDPAATFEYSAGLFQFLEDLARKVEAGKLPDTGNELAGNDSRLNELLENRATLGARINRMEAQQSRLVDLKQSYTEMLANTEDADIAEVIMDLKLQENVYRSALAAGARIIQPTLLDFLS